MNFLFDEKEQVHIGVGEQLTPAVSAHGKDGHAEWKSRRKMGSKRLGDQLVYERSSRQNGRSRAATHQEFTPYRFGSRVLFLHDLHCGFGLPRRRHR